MTTRKVLSLAVFAAGIAAITWTSIRLGPRIVRAESAPSSFTATVREDYFDAHGTLAMTNTVTRAMKADGSMMKRLLTVDGEPRSNGYVSDLPRRTRTVIDPVTESISTFHFGVGSIRNERDPTGGCKYDSDSPTATILGIKVRAYRVSRAAPGSSFREEGWVAPALGCFAMVRAYQGFDEAGKAEGRTVHTVTAIALGEPSEDLFLIPANYTERSPGEVMALRAASKGISLTSHQQAGHARLDSVYEARHAQVASGQQ